MAKGVIKIVIPIIKIVGNELHPERLEKAGNKYIIKAAGEVYFLEKQGAGDVDGDNIDGHYHLIAQSDKSYDIQVWKNNILLSTQPGQGTIDDSVLVPCALNAPRDP